MLILLVISLLLGGGDDARLMTLLDQTRDEIKQVVSDAPRRSDVLAILDTASKSADTFIAAREKLARSLLALEPRDAGSCEEYQQTLDQLQTLVEAHPRDMTRYRFAVKDKLTREEWEHLSQRIAR